MVHLITLELGAEHCVGLTRIGGSIHHDIAILSLLHKSIAHLDQLALLEDISLQRVLVQNGRELKVFAAIIVMGTGLQADDI
jgi:hypothetical protein